MDDGVDPDIQMEFQQILPNNDGIMVRIRINTYVLKDEIVYSDKDYMEVAFETTRENILQFCKELSNEKTG